MGIHHEAALLPAQFPLLQLPIRRRTAAGLGALPENVSGVLICLSDHPLVQTVTIEKITGHFNTHPDKIIIPVCSGKKGHPTLFPRAVLEEIGTVSTLRDIVHRDTERIALLDIFDPGVTVDVDTPEDFQRLFG